MSFRSGAEVSNQLTSWPASSFKSQPPETALATFAWLCTQSPDNLFANFDFRRHARQPRPAARGAKPRSKSSAGPGAVRRRHDSLAQGRQRTAHQSQPVPPAHGPASNDGAPGSPAVSRLFPTPASRRPDWAIRPPASTPPHLNVPRLPLPEVSEVR